MTERPSSSRMTAPGRASIHGRAYIYTRGYGDQTPRRHCVPAMNGRDRPHHRAPAEWGGDVWAFMPRRRAPAIHGRPRQRTVPRPFMAGLALAPPNAWPHLSVPIRECPHPSTGAAPAPVLRSPRAVHAPTPPHRPGTAHARRPPPPRARRRAARGHRPGHRGDLTGPRPSPIPPREAGGRTPGTAADAASRPPARPRTAPGRRREALATFAASTRHAPATGHVSRPLAPSQPHHHPSPARTGRARAAPLPPTRQAAAIPPTPDIPGHPRGHRARPDIPDTANPRFPPPPPTWEG
jgi:hypothetical protein